MKHQRSNNQTPKPALALAGIAAAVLLSGCGLTATGGVGAEMSNCDDACMAEREAARAAQAEQRAREAAIQQGQEMRAAAVAALDSAISDFTHRRPPSTPFDTNSPTRMMLRELADLRARALSTDASAMEAVYNEARALLDRAYMLAVNIGMFDPRTVGQRSANETWWYISS